MPPQQSFTYKFHNTKSGYNPFLAGLLVLFAGFFILATIRSLLIYGGLGNLILSVIVDLLVSLPVIIPLLDQKLPKIHATYTVAEKDVGWAGRYYFRFKLYYFQPLHWKWRNLGINQAIYAALEVGDQVEVEYYPLSYSVSDITITKQYAYTPLPMDQENALEWGPAARYTAKVGAYGYMIIFAVGLAVVGFNIVQYFLQYILQHIH